MNSESIQPLAHQVLGALLELSLAPAEITVHLELNILGEPPRADILLLRREGKIWNASQRALLPDGVRNNPAGHVLVEFKYTQSINDAALAQAIAYDHFYRQAEHLSEKEVLTVILSARTPRKDRLARWGYEELQEGVFRSRLPVVGRVWLLVLNKLDPKPHNAIVKVFASRAKEQEAALAQLEQLSVATSLRMQTYVFGLRNALKVKGDGKMVDWMTPEKVMEIGEKLRQQLIESATPEEKLAGLDPEVRVAGLDPEARLAGLDPEARLAGLDPEVRLSGLDPKDIHAAFDPEDILAGLDPEVRLAGLDPEDVLAAFDPETRLAGLDPEARVAGLDPEARLAGLDPEARVAGLDPEDVLAAFDPETRLSGLDPKDILAAFDPEEILAAFGPEARLAGLSPAERQTLLRLLDEEFVTDEEANDTRD